MTRRGITAIASAALSLGLLATAAAAGIDCCFVDDPSLTRCFVSPIQWNEELPGGVCGHTIVGTNCLVQIRSDVTLLATAPGGTNCLTIGPGVSIDAENHTFRCQPLAAPGACGSAVVVAGSGAGTQKVSIANGHFTGCWGTGAIRRASGGGTYHAVDNVTVDGAALGGCGSPGKGIDDIAVVGDVVVRNTVDFAVRLRLPGARIEDSILRGNATGLETNGSAGQTIDNVLLIDNGIAVDKTANTLAAINTRSSVIRASTVCHCVRAGVCDPTCSQGPLLLYSGESTFVDDEIR
ncbi:MAG: hypothetical protein U0802_04670 [Candidatus Binatia bacterium]